MAATAPSRPRLPARLLTTLAVALLVVLTTASGAHAADTRVAHIERTPTGFAVLVDVPDGAQPDLGSISATVNGQSYDASGELATDETDVKRVAIIAFDASDSMAGANITAARSAAKVFLDTAPANLAVGIVSFNSSVQVALQPTTDRAQATAVIDGIELKRGTRLNDGVLKALELAGTSGQRTVIVLSDGADTSSDASISDVTTALDRADVKVDVVGIDQSSGDLTTLQQLAGTGSVIDAAPSTLESTFSDEAAALSRQVAVSIDVPADAAADQSSITVTVPTSTGDLTADATVPAADVAPTDPLADVPVQAASGGGTATPHWFLYAGVGTFGVGLLVALVMLAPAKPAPMTVENRVSTYTQTTMNGPAAAAREQPNEAVLDQAKEAVAQVLSRNRDLDQRITQRLDAAGSELKSSEWILVNAGVVVGATLLGLLVGRGNIIIAFLFLLVGAFGPWLYLGVRRSRRRKKFNSVLPETLQLISGSLSAGLSLAQSVDTIVNEGADPIASEFRRVLVETRLGVPLEEAFEGVAERFESRDFAWVVMAIRIQRQVGGNLAELLDTVAATMREREYMRRQVAALAAEGKLSAYVLGFLPPLFLLYLSVTNFAYVKPLFTVPLGWAMLTGGALLLSLGVFSMSRLVKVEV